MVHRLLKLFPYRSRRIECELPYRNSPNSAIILGITDPTVHGTIRELLEKSNLRLVRMEDAINHCLETVTRNEMADVEYIDLNVVAATEKIVQQLQTGKTSGLLLKIQMVQRPFPTSARLHRDRARSSTSAKGREEKRKEKKKSPDSEKKS